MTKEEFICERTRIVSEMLDNPDVSGIYPTTKCFNELDNLFDKITSGNSDYAKCKHWITYNKGGSGEFGMCDCAGYI